MSNLTYSVSAKTRTGVLLVGDGVIRVREPEGNLVVLRSDTGDVIGVEVRDIMQPVPRKALDSLVTHDAPTARAVDEFLKRIERVRRELKRRK